MSVLLPPPTSYPIDLQDWLRFYIAKRCDPIFSKATNRQTWDLKDLATRCDRPYYPFRRIALIGDVRVSITGLDSIMRPLHIQMSDLLDLGREVVASTGKADPASRTAPKQLLNSLEDAVDAILALPSLPVPAQVVAGRMLPLLDQLYEDLRKGQTDI